MPPLPEKQAVGRFSTEFIESRRRGLEKFMVRVLKHPTLLNSEVLVTFLEADDVGLTVAKDKGKADKDKKAGSMMSWFESKVNTLTVQPNQGVTERTAADMKIDEISEYIAKLEGHMLTLSKHASSLLRKQRDVAAALRDFGQAYTYYGQAEGETLGTALIQYGTASEELAVLNADSVETAIIQFEEPLAEYTRILTAVKDALARRAAKKSGYQTAMIDLDAKVAAYNKALGVPGKESAANQKQQQVEAAQQALDTAKEEYEATSRIVIDEFEAFKAQKAVELRDISLSFATIQANLNKKTEASWADLCQRLRSTELPPGPTYSETKYSSAESGGYAAAQSNPFAASNFREEEGEMIGV